MAPSYTPTVGFFEINGQPVFIFSGEMHYFRIPRDLWYDRLLKARRAGLNTVASYIAWNWHEPREGLKLFGEESVDGFYESDAFSRDLDSYIQTASSLGLYFIARPGPYICSEWDSGGHPNWLYTKNPVLRSLDPTYMAYTEGWYSTIIPLVEKYSVTKGGPVLMVQVENEYFWGDANYIVKLYEVAKRYTEDLPIVTNEDWHVESTPVINTIDDYPSPWDIAGFDGKVRSYVRTQPGMPKMHMELEGGWFSTFGAPLPTNRGSFPAAWTETLVKTSIGLGVNAVNMYMFHGGTNPGYYTGKYITTTYDYEAAISEWGYLRDRYYALKRVAMFTRTFNDLLVATKPAEGLVQVSESGIDIFPRVSDGGGALAVLRNLGDQPRSVRLKYHDEVYPYTGSIHIPAKNAKTVILNYTIPGTPFKITYTASEPLLKLVNGANVLLVVYGDPGEVGGLAVEAENQLSVEYTSGVNVERRGKAAIVTCTHGSSDGVVVFSSSGFTLTIIATSRERAERTWLIDEFSEPYLLISNLYFVGTASKAGGKLRLELELDERSAGTVLLYSPHPPQSLMIDGHEVPLFQVYGNLYRFEVEVPSRHSPSVEEKGWITRLEKEYRAGTAVTAGMPLEFAGILDNGYVTYSIEFSVSEEELSKDCSLYLSYFNDFATVLLNGIPLASAYHSIEVDVSRALKPGSNELRVILESIGHPNDGQVYVPNGIVGGVYLGKLHEEELKGWLRIGFSIPYGKEFSLTQFLYKPELLENILNDPNLEQKAEKVDLIDGGGLYVKKLQIERKEGRYILVFTTRALLFVNKHYLGVYLGPVDLTEYLKEGENEIAIAAEWLPRGNPLFKVYSLKIEGEWRVAPGTTGLADGWYKVGLDESLWSATDPPLEVRDFEGRIIWLRCRFRIEPGQDVSAPLKLKVNARGVRMLLYFNGQFLGRFVSEGPQTDFYIPESLVKSGDNLVAIMMHVVSSYARIEFIGIEPYYVHPISMVELSPG